MEAPFESVYEFAQLLDYRSLLRLCNQNSTYSNYCTRPDLLRVKEEKYREFLLVVDDLLSDYLLQGVEIGFAVTDTHHIIFQQVRDNEILVQETGAPDDAILDNPEFTVPLDAARQMLIDIYLDTGMDFAIFQ